MPMNRVKNLLLSLGLIALLPALAVAQPLSKAEQGCLNTVNKSLSLIAKSQQKENAGCIKNYSKGKSSVFGCTAQDPKGKVAKQVAKLTTLFAKKCPGSVAASIQARFAPDTLSRVSGEGQNEPTRLSNAIFGLSLDDALFTDGIEGKVATKCQQGVLKEVFKCADTMRKEFLSCKKNGLKAGTVVDAATLGSACIDGGIPDLKGKIAKACSEKVIDTLNKKCDGIVLTDAFPGPACNGSSGSVADTQACLKTAVGCDLCNSLNSADGASIDCDLFDNGVDNGSCGACRTANDQTLIGNGTTTAFGVILGCTPEYTPECVGAPLGGVMQEASCAQCFGSVLTCTVTQCTACLVDAGSAACASCLVSSGCLECL